MTLLLGAIADDFTGATDLAGMLASAGMRTVLVLGEPDGDRAVPDAEAIVVALKSRTIEPAEAVRQSVASWRWLRTAGARQAFFKYCSTFDSTDEGNIGPVAEALWHETGEGPTVFVPSLPENGRTVYRGHLFIFDQLLSDSGMRHHPLTPMGDANLVRVLERQTSLGVGLVPYEIVVQGATAIRNALERLNAEGKPFAIVDTLSDADLEAIGYACDGLALVTGGSGLGLGLPLAFRRAGLLAGGSVTDLPTVGGPIICLSGSCSVATNTQVDMFEKSHPTKRVDPQKLADGTETVRGLVAWAEEHLAKGPALISTTARPEAVSAVQSALGRDAAAEAVEQALSAVAAELHAKGVRRFVIAGGETSGAVVKGLGLSDLAVGRQIAPGVPWCASIGDDPVAIALKSGNFGAATFFDDAIARAP